MLRQAYAKLSQPLREIVDEVENLMGFEIEVRHPWRRRGSDRLAEPGADPPGVAGVVLGHDEIAIEYPTTLAELSFKELAHELLHIRRTYLERSINLFPRDIREVEAASTAVVIDNLLEHQIIYADQIALCPGLACKIGDLARTWSEYPWPIDTWSGRLALLIGYIGAKRYGRSSASEAMKVALAQLSDGERAALERASERMLAAGDDKKQLIEELFQYSGLPRERFVLHRFEEPGKPFAWLPL
jgi:hypothetical protein